MLHLSNQEQKEIQCDFASVWERPLLLPEIEELGWRRPYSAAILKMGEEVGKIEVRREAGKVPCHHGQFARPG